jgi:outer membrane lipoprotein-sorting protein
MHRTALSFSFVMIVFLSSAQFTGYKPVTDASAFKQLFAAASLKITSVKSDFTQEKNLSLLSEKMISQGKFWYKKPGLLRMEYQHPFQYLMIFNNTDVLIKDGDKENKISSKSNKLFNQINDVMVDCIRGTVLQNPDFNTRAFEGKQDFLIELSPIAKNLKDYFRSIQLKVDKKDFSAISIEMIEQSGDNTIIHFTNKELNAIIPNSIFDIH